MPELCESTTPSVRPAATAASMAFPPSCSTAKAARVASGWPEATMPRVPVADPAPGAGIGRKTGARTIHAQKASPPHGRGRNQRLTQVIADGV